MLATKYRPSTFDDVVGQRASVLLLSRMVDRNMVPASLVFSGMRGTGKTSMARIFARALNPGESAEALFLWEIDAASSGGVDAMRSLVEDVRFSSPFFRVVVLDEVHAASSAGFQVLLKTLEEPPPRVVFVLVTTEPNKIPETILTRSMQCRFLKIPPADVLARLRFVADAEGIECSPDALRWIVDFADGGMRDALMVLDQARLMAESAPVTVGLLEASLGGRSAADWLRAVRSGNLALAVMSADVLAAEVGSASAVERAVLACREMLLGGPLLEGWSREDAVRAVPKLWKMASQIKRLGPDDRAALCALSAELCRLFGVGPGPVLSRSELEVLFEAGV